MCPSTSSYKLFEHLYKLLATSQPDYLHNLISVQSTCRTRCAHTLLLLFDHLYLLRYKSPTALLDIHLSNQLHQPHPVHSPPGSRHLTHISSSLPVSSLSPSITPGVFHSSLKPPVFSSMVCLLFKDSTHSSSTPLFCFCVFLVFRHNLCKWEQFDDILFI